MTDLPEVADPDGTQRGVLIVGSGVADLAAAAAAVRAGECVVLPTDTVYGIGADAFSSSAVQRLLDAKRRGADMPPPVLIAEPGMLRALTIGIPTAAHDLARAFWPGALTLILKAQRTLDLQIGDTGGTVAVRVPDHEVARDLLRRTGPLAVSSANVSGQPAATSVNAAVEQLGTSVAVYIDAGESKGGMASTIVDFSAGEQGRVLREGAISFERLVDVVPDLVPLACPEGLAEQEPPISAEDVEPEQGSEIAVQ